MPLPTTLRESTGLLVRSTDGKNQPRIYTFQLSDGGTDRHGTRFDSRGWQLDNYHANPAVFLNHDWREGQMPIGRGHAYLKNDVLMLDVVFDPDDAKAREVERKVAAGFLRGISIGVKALEWANERNPDGSQTCTKQELLEASIVPLPSNPRSLKVQPGGDRNTSPQWLADPARDVAAEKSDFNRAIAALDRYFKSDPLLTALDKYLRNSP